MPSSTRFAADFKLHAIKTVPAREIPIELRVSRNYSPTSLETRIGVDGTYKEGEHTHYIARAATIDDQAWTEDEIVDLVGFLAKCVARKLDAELQ